MEEIASGGDRDAGGVEDENLRSDGRTYVATRAMPGGQGAFAYVAVSLAEQEPKWLGGGEGYAIFLACYRIFRRKNTYLNFVLCYPYFLLFLCFWW